MRAVKDEIELERIRKAVEVADKTFDRILNFVKPGLTEREIAWEMEKFMKEAGVERLAWEPFIVAAGANSSMAHWGASGTKIKEKDMILVDFGCVYQSYCSDLSRVIFVGKPSAEQVKIYKLVLEAQKFGIGLVKEGRIGSTVDKKTRLFLEKRLSVRQAKNIYRHALGHGVGLEVHELPPLSIRHKHKLAAGNVVTVEPGIYIPGWGGVRIEDMVLVTENGGKVLTKASKKIEEVTV
ncbi:MAG: hypothetical protein A2126_04730 [Candidatus Woykebacteria bacterium GWB1_45_5]|uniref:Peptidase M24 domain-containing protein n=1 Tax=Candidatus Woykebacteria bacterium GWB1_45_5 TaxID=1802592 RepID=A0A1G1WAU0_9BACT|nr:MAG: hypothetical protein A2126_04730 [Candidatus Woykebacteria bacterium GWB1_45_5]